ncbi:MAG: sugar phosphate isomerase/epimerase family protein [Terriglobia bacterium]|jgi:sugar phosphate isomerase/epimerase
MKNSSRRDFFLRASIFGLGLSAGLRNSLASPKEPHLDFPTNPRARLAVTSWPFREFIDSPGNSDRNRAKPGMDLKDFPGMIAKRFGIQNVCLLAGHFHSTDPAYLEALRQALAQAGSHLVDLGLGGRNFWDPDKTQRQAAVEYGQHWIDRAVKLGSPSVRQHLDAPPGVKPDVELASQTLGRLAEYGAAKNILVNLENDDLINEDPFFIVKVIEKVGNPYLRALPDFGNTLAGGDAGYNERGVAAMLKHACGVCHIKDVVVTDDGKTYKVDLPKMFELAQKSGFKGYYMMEWDGGPGDPYEGTERLVAETLKCISGEAHS